jgi:phospholipase/carboxylesterase
MSSRRVILLRSTWIASVAAAGCEVRTSAPGGGDPAPPAASAAAALPGDPPPVTAPPAPPPDEHVYAGIVMVERVLGGAGEDEPLPLVVAIHGLGDDPRNFGRLFDGFDTPARLLLPRGLDATEGGGWSWFPIRARDPDVEALARGIDRAGDLLAGAIVEAAAARPTLGKPIVTGFSQGGMISFAIAVDHPEIVAAALPMGGFLPGPLVPTDAGNKDYPPIDAYHGTDDRAVAYTLVQDTVASLGRIGVKVELHSYEGVGHAVTPELHHDFDERLRSVLVENTAP